ncbi:hypothetical protein ACGFIF_31215 [Kribbella sp. NPDC049174]|uniref:hypothetical protein n=1 Tax=Kribbella sp. NPDC049174 TaxID=3364112 RepID=UPI00371EF717
MTDAVQGGTEWVPRFGMLEVSADRARLIRGLFELAAWVADHPDLPLPDVTAHVPTRHDGWDAERTLVDQVAPALEVEPEFDQDGAHYRAERFFGSVRVYCLAIEPQWMAAFAARSLAARKATEAAKSDRAAESAATEPSGGVR